MKGEEEAAGGLIDSQVWKEDKVSEKAGSVLRWSSVRREPQFQKVQSRSRPCLCCYLLQTLTASLSIHVRLCHIIIAFLLPALFTSAKWTQALWFITYHSSASKRTLDHRQPLCLHSSFLRRWLMWKSWISHAPYIIWYVGSTPLWSSRKCSMYSMGYVRFLIINLESVRVHQFSTVSIIQSAIFTK